MKIFDFLSKNRTKETEKKVWTIVSDNATELYFKELAFYIAVSYISNTISKCEFKVYKENEEVKDELYYLLNVAPNDNETANQFKNKIVQKLFYDNQCLVFERRDKLYVADSFGIDEHPLTQNKFNNISVGIDNVKGQKNISDVFYFKIDDENINSLISGISESYQKLLTAAYSVFQNSAFEKYKLKIDQVKAGNPDFNHEFEEVIKEQLEDFINNPKAIYPEFSGYNLTSVKQPASQTDSSDIRNIRKEVFEVVAQAFKMPVSMLYGNMTNVKDIVNAYITFTIEPIAEMIGNELTRKTSTFEEWKNGNHIKIDLTSIYHVDIFDIADKVDKLISNGVYCVDEIRKKLGEKMLDTDFSKQHWITKNYSTSEDALEGEAKEVINS